MAASGTRSSAPSNSSRTTPTTSARWSTRCATSCSAIRRGNPGWLVEGIADYIRFFKFEPRAAVAEPEQQSTAASGGGLPNYVAEKYDKTGPEAVNKAMREGEYTEELWKELTKKTVQELDEEWRASLKK